MAETQTTELAELTSEIVASYVAKNSVRPGDLPALIMSIYQTLGSLGHTASPPPAIELKPAQKSGPLAISRIPMPLTSSAISAARISSGMAR